MKVIHTGAEGDEYLNHEDNPKTLLGNPNEVGPTQEQPLKDS